MSRSLLLKRAPVPSWPERIDLFAGDGLIAIRVRRHPRARRFALRVAVATGDVVLTLPPGSSILNARRFAERHVDWITERLAQRPLPVPFAHGAIVPLRGKPHRIVHRRGRGVVERRRAVEAGALPTIVVPGETAHVARRVRDYLKAQAERDLAAAVDRHAATLGVAITKVQIKDTRSRWGSCSSKGAVALSWRLVLAPPFVLDYLAAHEVAHRREMNHGPRFWRLVRSLAPQTDRAEAWLKAYGRNLHRYGAAPAATERE
ncbi:MAG TPA: SprT family zinc-dependent metalloprotease [Hyphomicrobiales bacterium]|nr:SprT family zinc-dependent metalloprotease [Hyphomicrobiales bacterium]